MKKYLVTAMMLLVLVALVACNNNGATEGDNSNSTELSPIPHVGAAHETHEIVFALDLPNANWQVCSIQIGADHGRFGYGEYTLTIFYEPHSDFQGEITERIPDIFFENTASRLFGLIGNLQAVTFSVNNERTTDDVIVGYDYRFSITRSGTRKASPTAYLPLEELKIQIDTASDELLSTFTHLHHVDIKIPGDSEGETLVVWANQALPSFAVITLTHDLLEDSDEWGFRPTDSFGSVEMLLPGEAFVIENFTGLGTLPHRGISFSDEHGANTRVFFFQENQAYPEHGGQWIIQEIEAGRIIWTSICWFEPPSDGDYSIIVNEVGSVYPSDSSETVVKKITVVERGAEESTTSYFNVSIISETLVDSGFGMNDDFGGCILIFELVNIFGSAVTVDISAVFPFDYGRGETLIDQNVHFEPNQARQFTHSFGEYVFNDSLHLIIEYWNVRYEEE